MTQSTLLILMAIGLVAVLAVTALVILRGRRTKRLRAQFGPEYTHAVYESGRGKAEADLRSREKHVAKLTLKPLTASDRAFYVASWRKVQAQFVDDPNTAVVEADRLLGAVMTACGYSVSAFEQRSADVSVDHPQVVENYRAAHEVAVRNARGEASTEDLRGALIHYRTLFEDLAGVAEASVATAAE